MLIDFEKAFDSISWKFLYNVLDYLGFTEGYIKWIKLLNKGIPASVVQAGCKSEFLNIERGCKQGDPIAAYLFLLGAQSQSQSWGFTSRSTARVILGQVLRIATCGTRTHRGDSL